MPVVYTYEFKKCINRYFSIKAMLKSTLFETKEKKDCRIRTLHKS